MRRPGRLPSVAPMASRRARRGNRNKGGRWIRAGAIFAISAIAAVVGGYLWLRSYLHSDDFRHFLEAQTAAPLQADAQFAPFRWDGLQLSSDSFSAASGPLVTKLHADGLQTEIGLGGVSRGVWELKTSTINRLILELDTTGTRQPAPAPAPASQPAPQAEPSWISGLIPRELELEPVTVSEAAVSVRLASGMLRAVGQKWVIRPDAAKGSYRLEATGGRLSAPWPLMQDAKVGSMVLQSRPGWLFLTDADIAVGKRGKLTLSGEMGLDDGTYGFEGALRDLKAEEVLPEDWKRRLIGDLQVNFAVRPGSDGPVTRGELEVKNGVLTGLPLLDRLAAYADVTRFRTLNLRDARLKFTSEPSQLTLYDIEIGSEGLVRLEGRMVIRGEALDGNFRLGITPGTLARIPGAETKVFLPGERGLLWTPVRISGTIDEPQEDLSERLIIAAGERMFEIIPETGQKALKFAGTAASEGVLGLLNGAGEILNGDPKNDDGSPVERIGNEFFNLIPGLGN